MKSLFADRIGGMAQSDIRRMSIECARVEGINLGQGICDQPIEPLIKEAAIRAIKEDRSTYTRLDGIDELRRRIAKKMLDYNRVPCDPDGEVVVNVGSTGSFVTACLAFVNPGDEVILFTPFYGYHLHILKLCGAVLRYVPLKAPDWAYDRKVLEAAFSPRTKFILVNTPVNPCGKVFTRAKGCKGMDSVSTFGSAGSVPASISVRTAANKRGHSAFAVLIRSSPSAALRASICPSCSGE